MKIFGDAIDDKIFPKEVKRFTQEEKSLIDKFMNYPVDCRLILPESKFKFIEGLDSEGGFDFYNVSFSPFYGTNFLVKNT